MQLERLAAGFRLFALYGFDEGLAGHITYRDPEFKDHFWVNPLGVNFAQICISDLLLVNEGGSIIQGERPLNPAAFSIHSAVHKARPDANSAAHAHAQVGPRKLVKTSNSPSTWQRNAVCSAENRFS